MEPPSQRLAKRILNRLTAEGILREDDARILSPKLSAGTVRQEDWRLAVEKAFEKKGNE